MKHGDCTNEVGHCSTFSSLWEHIATVQDHATQHCHLGPQDPRKDHSRLSRARCLQMNSQVAAFFAIYKSWTLLHRTNVRISANVAKTSRNVSWHVCSFCEFLSNSIFSPLMLMKRFRNLNNVLEMLELHKNFEKSQILTDRVRAVVKKCVTKTLPISRSRGYPVQNSRAWGACKSGSPRRTDRPALKWCALKIEIRTPRPDSKFGRGKASYNAEQGLCHDRKKKQEFAREQKKSCLKI